MKRDRGIFLVLLGLISLDILRYIGLHGKLEGTDATYFSAIIVYLTFFWLVKSQFNGYQHSKERLVKLWLNLLIFAFIYGLFLSSDYWDYKQLFLHMFGFSITPLFFFVGLNNSNFLFLSNFYSKWVFIFGVVLIPIGLSTNYELYSRIMIPVTFLLLLFPFVNFFSKILLVSVSFLSILTAPDFRSLQIKMAIGILLVIGFYFRRALTKKIMLTAHTIIFFIPFIFMISAVYFDYNFFRDGVNANKEEYIVNIGEVESDLRADTRTFLYLEIFADLKGYEWLIGKSAIGSYKSSFYGEGGGSQSGKRYSTEVGVLNIILKNGIIGVGVYLILLFKLTRRAIVRSNNYLISSLALLLAFRWPLTFIEEFTQYDLNFFFFWVLLGFISNKKVQQIGDLEMTNFINSKMGKIHLNRIS
jgi:hypothetical protein